MSLPRPPARNKTNRTLQPTDSNSSFQATSMAQLHGSVPGRIVVLSPERTFKLRDPLDPHGLLENPETGNHGSSSSSTVHKIRSSDRGPVSVSRSYSLSSYDEIVRDNRRGRRWPRNYCFCLLGAFFCIGIGAAFGIYFGFQNARPEKLMEYTYRGKFRIVDGDWYQPVLADLKSAPFAEKARDYESKIDALFRNSQMKDVYLNSEIITFEGNDNNDLIVFFNVYCWAKKTANDASDMESILRDEFSLVNSATFGTKIPEKQSLYFDGITVDQSDIEVKVRSATSATDGSKGNGTANDLDYDGTYEDSPFSPTSFPNDDLLSQSSGPKPKKANAQRPTTASGRPPPSGGLDDGGCVPVSLKFCRHLPYNFTSYPNLLGHRGPRDADRLNEAAKLLVETECSSYIQHVLCHLLEPPCSGIEDVTAPDLLPPCRSVCMAVSATCKAKLGLSQQISRRQDFFGNKLLGNDVITGLRDLLRCDLFPIDDGLGSCTANPIPNHSVEEEPSDCVQSLERDGQSHRVCDGLMDCHDFSDEVACDYCPEGMVHCGVGAACIDVDRRCDGIPDCPNNSDERGCLTVAPDMDAANFVHQYFPSGYVVFTEGNNTGKICVDSLNTSSLTISRQQNFLEMFGESACRSMSYRRMDHIEVRTDNEKSGDYAHLTEPIRWRTTFLRAPCRKRQVLHLSCSGLECGMRPVHTHPDRPIKDMTRLPASHGDWPWLAALHRDGVHACDGTLVSDQWMLTSATCFEGQAKAHWTARFAAVRLTSDAPWEQERRIIGMVHSPLSESNIVLIKLETPVIYSDFVRPVCLAGDHQSWTSTNSRCVFLGWEKNGDSLHEVTAKVVKNEKCNNVTTFCTDVFAPRDICRDDEFAGSPILCQVNDGGAWSLVGVSYETIHCDTPLNQPGNRIYDAVLPVADWVVQTVRR